MEILSLHETDIKSITLFLIKKKLILHLKISPEGTPDFTGYEGEKFTLIFDRNLLSSLIKLVKSGTLKDPYLRKVVSSLLFWTSFNGINITSGLALAEYSHHHKSNIQSNEERDIFFEIFQQYPVRVWLELALEKRKTIPKITHQKQNLKSFWVELDRYKIHYLEMLKLAQLYFDTSKKVEQKFQHFYQWVYDNILICKYTTYLAAFLFGGKSKIFKNQTKSFEGIKKACQNQAWDLTYLSGWSSFYSYESSGKDFFLFATMDKELKKLFTRTIIRSDNIFIEIFGKEKGREIIDLKSNIYLQRKIPEIKVSDIDKMIAIKEKKLEELILS